MEQLLFILFVLFSIVSALLERRKRRKQLEEQRRRTQGQQQPPQARPQPQEEEEEEEIGWPFGGDPFQVEWPQSRQSGTQAETVQRSALEREQEALAAERRALEMERLALETARQTQGGVSRQRLSDVLRQRLSQQPLPPSAALQVGRWKLDPTRARDAIVYAEILGPPRAERPEIH